MDLVVLSIFSGVKSLGLVVLVELLPVTICILFPELFPK